MAYTPPALNIRQEFTTVPATGDSPLYACVLAPHYGVHPAAEAPAGTAYDAVTGNKITAWPGKIAGGVVDMSSVRVFMEAAELLVLSGAASLPVTGGRSIRVPGSVLKTGNGSVRAAALGERDIQPGDTAIVTKADGVTSKKLRVVGVSADVVAAVIGPVVTVVGTHAADDVESAGTYTGATSTNYIIKVVTAGKVGTAAARLSVKTADGSDPLDEVTVAAEGSFQIGSKGVELTFADDVVLALNDTFTVSVAPATVGAYKTVALSEPLASGAVKWLSADTYTVKFTVADPLVELESSSWEADSAAIDVYGGITAPSAVLNPSTPSIPRDLPVLSGAIRVQYRERLFTNNSELNAVSSIADVPAILGEVSPDNPIAMMVHCALLGSGGVPVYYVSVDTDDISGYAKALDVCSNDATVYSMLPHSADDSILDQVAAFVEARSAPDVAVFGKLWCGADISAKVAVAAALPSGMDLLATIVGNSLECAGASFVQAGVLPGDEVRFNYGVDNKGLPVYDTAVVDSVVGEESLTLTRDVAEDVAVAVKCCVWHPRTASETAVAVSAKAARFHSRRVNLVWSDTLAVAGFEDVLKIYLACVLAGQRSYYAPHQPLTNMPVPGVGLGTDFAMGSDKLNEMAGNGVWLVVKNVQGDVYTRHQVTTDNTDINHREDTVTTNLDGICRETRTALKGFIGRCNVSDAMLGVLRMDIFDALNAIKSRTYSKTLGSRLNDFSITQLYIDATARDKVWCTIEPVMPYPLNNMDVTFVVL